MYEFFARYVSVPLATPVLLAIGGLLVGALVVWMVAPSRKQVKALEADLEAVRSEHRSYRIKVTEHFQKTSDLVASMTASYKAVYDHLAGGAHDLCDGRPALEGGKFGVPILIADRTVSIGETASPGSSDKTAQAKEQSWTMSEPAATAALAGAQGAPSAASTATSQREDTADGPPANGDAERSHTDPA